MKFSAALDFSWNEASFAIVENNKEILVSEKLQLSGHDASALPVHLKNTVIQHGLDPAAILHWTVGTGPGGFTGLRIASALVIGLTYGIPHVKVRGMSSASALVRSAIPQEKRTGKCLALFDGRRSELLAYGLEWKNGSCYHDGFKAVLHTPAELEEAISSHPYAAALQKDAEAISRFSPGMENSVIFTPSINAEELIFNAPEDETSSPTDLIYLRAAVFVDPRIPRKI